LKNAPADGLKVIRKRVENLGLKVNGWNIMTGAVGYYGSNYDRDKLKFIEDGSLTISIQNKSPGADKKSNWLPALEGGFTLAMHCYSPRPQIDSSQWAPPPVKQVK